MGLQRIEGLRRQIAALEARPVLADSLHARAEGSRTDGLPQALPGDVQEIFADERRNGSAALGFALAQARGLLTPQRPAVIHLHLVADGQELGLPYGPGLKSFGLAPEALVFGQIGDITELLWAMEEAIACRAVAAVIADLATHHRELDFTASRRLSLRAAAAGTSVFLLRYGQQREASAARLRWRLSPALSGVAPYDPRAPGPPRWRAELEKGHLDGVVAGEGGVLLDWTDNGLARIDDNRHAGADRVAGREAASGAPPAAVGYRLPQTA